MQELMTPDEVAKILRVTKTKVYRLVRSGDLQCYRVGNRMRFDEDQVQDYLRSGDNPPGWDRHFR